MAANDIERLIRARIPDAEVTIRDLAGDGDHYAATVIAESFRGKSRVQQHQIVYEGLKAEMGGKLHALALQTGTPERWGRQALHPQRYPSPGHPSQYSIAGLRPSMPFSEPLRSRECLFLLDFVMFGL